MLRHQVQLEWDADGGLTFLRVHVVNDGRQPVAVSSIDVQNFVYPAPRRVRLAERLHASRWLPRLRWFSVTNGGGQGILPSPRLTQPLTLQPGQTADFAFPVDRLVPFAADHQSETIYIVVTDILWRKRSKVIPKELVSFIGAGAQIPPTPEAARAARQSISGES